MMLMYDTTPIAESKLPPVYIRKEHKRLKMDPLGNIFSSLVNLCHIVYIVYIFEYASR